MNFIIAAILSLPLLAVATPVTLDTRGGGEGAGSCPGSLACCKEFSPIPALPNMDLGQLNGTFLGIGCSTPNLSNGGACTDKIACCAFVEDIIAIGCVPLGP